MSETKVVLTPTAGEPLIRRWGWSREPVVDHAAEAANPTGWRMMKSGPYAAIDLSAYGVINGESP